MKVLLKQDVHGTGKAGDIVNVSDGYANNFLIPRKLAVPADAQTVAAAGELMSVELTGLDYNSVYYYAAYVKTSTGETYYGEQRSFTIGENPTGIISVKEAEEQDKSAGTRPIMTGWFTLDGRRLQTAPTRSGIYIHNGKKISLR